MPIFIDGHKMGGLDASKLKKIVNNPPDKYGVTHNLHVCLHRLVWA